MFETHSHTQCLGPVEMAKPSLYRPGEAEWPLELYKIKALRILVVVELLLTRPEPIWPN